MRGARVLPIIAVSYRIERLIYKTYSCIFALYIQLKNGRKYIHFDVVTNTVYARVSLDPATLSKNINHDTTLL